MGATEQPAVFGEFNYNSKYTLAVFATFPGIF
jgi:hypothetical protein